MKLNAPVEVKSIQSATPRKTQAGFAGTRLLGYEIRWTDIHGNKHTINYGADMGKQIVDEARREGLLK
jgi:hypothetical protein